MLPKYISKKNAEFLTKLYFIYGDPKIGKSTLVAHLGNSKDEKVLFICTEAGHSFLEIYKYKVLDSNGKEVEPTTWPHFLECCRELVTSEHDFKMLAIDTIDNLWDWCSDYVLNQHRVEHPSDLPFGKGYALIRDEFLKPIKYLSQIGMGMAFLSHAKTVEKELGPRKITYTTSTLPNTAAKTIHGISDYIFYLHSDLEGNRLIQTKGTELINAGDRSGNLPEVMPLSSELLISELTK